jgi:serine/threonine-protein kinase
MAKHGRYTVVRKVANGGMAEIFLASQQGHEGFHKPVVLKRIHGTIYSDPQFRNMLIDEAHISMSLTHSNIVQVLDLGLAGGRYFLVLELIDGWDLGHILQRAKAAGTPLPLELGIFIATDVCRALAYAHGKRGADGKPLGIVHRDVSPNNVLISEHGEVKLTDFGIAKAMNKREHTGTGVVKGKVAFMSPEQALGKPIDGRSDVFSLGTLLYVLMVGVRPFEASTDLETLLRVQRAEFKPPARVRPDIEPEVARIILRAMRFEPDDRYQSADEMLLDLERVLRTLYGGVGQTELKFYVLDLGRKDGIPPIGRARPVLDQQREEASGGAELHEGNAVVLADATEDLGSEKTDLAELTPDGDVASSRRGRRTVEIGHFNPELVLGRETTPSTRAMRRPVDELAIPDGAIDEAPPVRYTRSKSLFLPVVIFTLVAGGGGFAAARYFGWTEKWSAMLPGAGGASGAETTPAPGEGAAAPGAPTTPPGTAPEADPQAAAAAAAPPAPAPTPAPAHTAPAVPAARSAEAYPDTPPTRAGGATPPAKPGKGGAPARGGTTAAGAGRDVFKESAKRVRSISQSLELPPGSIELRNVPEPTPPPPPAPEPAP